MFPKAHAAAYMISALRLGWYKVHRPVEYYAAYFSVRGEDFDGATVIQGREAVRRRMNEMLPVDLYKSDAKKYVVENGKIRLPFSSLAGVGEAAANALAEARETGGPYISVDDLQARSKVSKAVIEMLEQAGSLKELPASSQMTLF